MLEYEWKLFCFFATLGLLSMIGGGLMNESVNLLVTIDENYIEPLEVMLFSLFKNNPKMTGTVWLIHENILDEDSQFLTKWVESFNWEFRAIKIDNDYFNGAKTVERYPKEMYFRLLCGDILPKEVKRVLYLDPDILILNSLEGLWRLNLQGSLLAAATHKGVTNISSGINNIRLNTDHDYYNSGVMLIDVDKARDIINIESINDAIEKFGNLLLLPDQDVLNYLYGKYIKEIPEEHWNYDARKYMSYLARSRGNHDLFWMMTNTAILHFCGESKPWQKKHDTRFTALYLDYLKDCRLSVSNI